MLASLRSLCLRAELVKPVSKSVLSFSLLENSHALVKTLDLQSAVDPLLVVVLERLSVEHVPDTLKLADLHPTRPHSLLLSDFLLRRELIGQVLVAVHDIFRHGHHFHVDFLVLALLPLHEGPAETALVLVDQAHLDTVHAVTVELAILLPGHQCLVLDVAVLEIRLAQSIVLRLCSSLLGKALSLVLKFLTLRNLGLKHHSCLFELHLSVAKSNRVEALLKQALSPHTLDVGY